jgi:hypothetical protein
VQTCRFIFIIKRGLAHMHGKYAQARHPQFPSLDTHGFCKCQIQQQVRPESTEIREILLGATSCRFIRRTTLDHVRSVGIFLLNLFFLSLTYYVDHSHLMILEILQNIYNQVDNVPPVEEQNFALFCLFGIPVCKLPMFFISF